MIRHAALAALTAVLLGAALAPAAPRVHPAPTRDDYRHFRTLSLDLLGRVPTRDELATFERPDFDVDAWIDQRLTGDAYVDRLERIYMDALRLEVGPAFTYVPPSETLRRQIVLGPDKKPIYVYYRQNQRRTRPETDGEFCLSLAETGQSFPNNQPPRGTAIPVTKKVLEENTTIVRPWWLYRDYRDPLPNKLYGRDWNGSDSYVPVKDMLVEADGTTTTLEVRVCKEEAQPGEVGHLYVADRQAAPKAMPGQVAPKGKPPVLGKTPPQPPMLPFGRLRPVPGDDPYAKQHKGEPISCTSALASTMTIDCGCGVGLERCMPGDGFGNDPRAFALPIHSPIGIEGSMGASPQNVSFWHKFWWSQEAQHFMRHIFKDDRAFSEMLTARSTEINGPLAQFYRSGAPASCCGRERAFKMVEEAEPLFNPSAVPADLLPHDAARWVSVNDRGPHAAGLLTTPAFLTKYASRRARGAAIYTTFLCKTFVADHVDLMPSTEPNLMIRQGCSTCHATLEPLAAYFSRIEETSWTFLPKPQFPVENAVCKKNAQGKAPGFCDFFYDVTFSDAKLGKLRGAYASEANAESGPAGAAADITKRPEFAQCAVERVTSSFLGRPLRDEDTTLLDTLRATFVAGGYRMRPLVGALVRSRTYQGANNDSSALRRREGHE